MSIETSSREFSATPPLDWFPTARYGLFVHYGLYSIIGHGEWSLNREGIPLREYRELARQFTAENFNADEICDLAVRSGMRYVVFTTMHHDGFALYDTSLTDFNSVAACGRDLTAEIVEAARRRGLRIGLYHSLNNWMAEPDGVAALENTDAREKFVRQTHERLRELVTRYNPVDLLWYDGWWPFNAEGWQAEEMNAMVRSIQPHILFNGRNGLPGDFATPEGHLTPPSPWRPWEACMPLNNSWGYHSGDHDWKTPRQIVGMLADMAAGQGNLLLNIGPRGDGSIPKESIEILNDVGAWLCVNGECIYDTVPFTYGLRSSEGHRSDWCHHGPFTARDDPQGGGVIYLLALRWPGQTLHLQGVNCKVRRVGLLGDAAELPFVQEGTRLSVTSLPASSPDGICSVFRIECADAPRLYWTGGMRVPRAPHPPYDPCPSDIAH